jgi:cation/acetate symporter
VFSGTPTSMFGAGVNFAWFPLSNPGIVSIPIGFFLGWLGSVTSTRTEDPLLAAEMSVRSLTGHGAEKAVEH